MDIKDYVKIYSLPFDKVKTEFNKDFNSLYESEKEWLENLENKVHLLKNENNEEAVKQVIQKLKGNNLFQENDTPILSTFVSKVNTIVRIANRVNNFKEGTDTDNGSTLKLYDFFNSVKASQNLNSFNYQLNSNLDNFLPHIYSVIKHCQNPAEYPIYYKYWKNILREVLSKEDDYDSMCKFYRSFPSSNRHLNFATYLGTIGIQIAKNTDSSGIQITKDSREYKYLTKDVINIERYNSILDTQLNIKNESSISFYDILLKVKSKAEEVGFKFNSFTEKSRYVWIKDQHSIIGNKIAHYEIITRRNKVYVEIHFEDSKNHNYFHSQISHLPENLKWFKWNKGGQSIRYTEYSIEEKDLYNKLLNDLINFDKLIGDEIRSLINNISTNMESECKTEFIQWLCKNPKAEYWNNDQNKIGEALDTYNNYFTSNIFNVNLANFEKISAEITKTLYNEEINDFLDFSSKDSNHRPRAILGKRNYLKFLSEKFSSNQAYKTEEQSLNTILYGPPGTGKTYNTVNEALKIINKEFLENNINNRGALNEKFRELRYNPESEEGQIAFVTFHQSMSYEDFIEGIKPLKPIDNEPVKYDIINGVFKSLSKKASEKKGANSFDKIYDEFKNDILEKESFSLETLIQKKTFDVRINGSGNCVAKPQTTTATEMVVTKKMLLDYLLYGTIRDWKPYLTSIAEYIKNNYKFQIDEIDNTNKPYVLIIDEINRGNVSQIFGELITLIEPDKRKGQKEEVEVILPYSKEKFSVPSNLYIIGTMNTADRSVEALDTALRRRFSFVEMNPKPSKLNSPEFNCTGIDLEAFLTAINARIEKLLDKDYCIGHSYFMSINNLQEPLTELKSIFQNKIMPLLQEYFYGDWGKIMLVIGKEFIVKKEDPIKFLSNGLDEEYEEYNEKPIYYFKDSKHWTLDSFKSIYE